MSDSQASSQAEFEAVVADFKTKMQQLGVSITPEMFGIVVPTSAGVGHSGHRTTIADDTGSVYTHQFAQNSFHTGGEHLQGAAWNGAPERRKNEFEKVPGDIPIEKFPYGEPEADWSNWSSRFEKAVKAATNAYDTKRVEELCLVWISLK